MSGFDIHVLPEHCTGCFRCVLSCAQSRTGRFSLTDSRILVEVSPAGCTITFHDECTGCGLCSESCLYGALVNVRREDGP